MNQAQTLTKTSLGRVLVVDDDAQLLRSMKRTLSAMGFDIDTAVNGRIAAEKIGSSEYNCVVSDISMPEMDGVEATRAIRSGKDPDIDSNVAIVGLSAHSLQGDEDESLEAGMNAYLTKPVTLEQLEEIVKRFLAS